MTWDFRWVPAVGGALATAGIRACCAVHPLVGVGVGATGLALSYAASHTFPVLELGPHESLLAGGAHVGLRHVGSSNGAPPLSIYYPTNVKPLAPASWLPHGDTRYIEGIASYAKVPEFVFSHWNKVTIRATRNAAPAALFSNGAFRPVVVLSHGLAGNGHMLSALACDLASQGAIVVSMEHCDGSASFSRDTHPDDFVSHRKPPSDDETAELAFREKQLAHRVEEVRATIQGVSNGTILSKMHFDQEEVASYLNNHDGVSRPLVLAGHSFGAATAFTTAVKDHVEGRLGTKAYGPLTLKSVELYDLWGWPTQSYVLPAVRKSGVEPLPCCVKFYDSQQWDMWQENKQYIEELVREPSLRGHREVVSGTDHMTVCDIGLLIRGKIGRKSYKTADDRTVILGWANKLIANL